MGGLRNTVFKAGLEALYLTNIHKLTRQFVGGMGAILTLHHVRPTTRQGFAPNALLEITPEFLASVIIRIRATGFDIVSIDEAHRRLTSGQSANPFIVFTFDDGYRDNVQYAYPILKRHEVPFAMYLPTAFMDGEGEFWWLTLEEIIRSNDLVTASINGDMMRFNCRTDDEKQQTFDKIYWWMRSLPGQDMYRYIEFLSERNGVKYDNLNCSLCQSLCLNWDEIRDLGRDPLVTFGAHTVEHVMLAKFDYARARAEMLHSRQRIEAELDRPVEHLCYPVGDPGSAGPREFEIATKLGFKTGVTTRPGVLFPEHQNFLTALPRVSLNGQFQSLRYLDVLLSGAAFALFNRFRRVNAA